LGKRVSSRRPAKPSLRRYKGRKSRLLRALQCEGLAGKHREKGKKSLPCKGFAGMKNGRFNRFEVVSRKTVSYVVQSIHAMDKGKQTPDCECFCQNNGTYTLIYPYHKAFAPNFQVSIARKTVKIW
jgi:hypothetical protein